MDSTVIGRLTLLALLPLLPVMADAQALIDPTRPPDAPLSVEGAVAEARKGPQLQSVLVSDNGRRVAVIDGRTVRVGDRIGNASVAGIAGTSVVLQRGKAMETLRLYPRQDAQAPGKAGKKRAYADQ